ncbi:MAG: fluoride efflux transporter CrcB [Thermoplasmata archaeon]
MKLESMAMLAVGLGGFIGAMARYGLSEMLASAKFPYGTLMANILGSLILGFIIFYPASSGTISDEWRLFICVGVLGAFTTMSAFSAATFLLIENNEIFKASLNVILNVAGSLLAIFAGKALATLNCFSAV